MTQAERMNSASNAWEADPWDASDEVANSQLKGFQERAAKTIGWTLLPAAARRCSGSKNRSLWAPTWDISLRMKARICC
jgi:hypothetical protein